VVNEGRKIMSEKMKHGFTPQVLVSHETTHEQPACSSQRGDDGTGRCIDCGQPVGASGCDGGSWVHVSTKPLLAALPAMQLSCH
jgi:hypothetical protein